MGQPAGPLPDMVCGAAVQRLLCPGVGVTVAVNDDLLQSAHGTVLGRRGDGLQEDLGEGPAYTAFHAGRPALAADLADDPRWPAFTRAAAEVGILASFSFPIGVGAEWLGTLNLYRPAATSLDDDQHADALILARLALDVLTAPATLDGQGPAPGGHEWRLREDPSPQVHQATGMVSAQLGLDMADALATLRAHAYGTDRHLSDVASDVVTRKLRFQDDPRGTDGGPGQDLR